VQHKSLEINIEKCSGFFDFQAPIINEKSLGFVFAFSARVLSV
jgi:hypothetical protein